MLLSFSARWASPDSALRKQFFKTKLHKHHSQLSFFLLEIGRRATLLHQIGVNLLLNGSVQTSVNSYVIGPSIASSNLNPIPYSVSSKLGTPVISARFAYDFDSSIAVHSLGKSPFDVDLKSHDNTTNEHRIYDWADKWKCPSQNSRPHEHKCN